MGAEVFFHATEGKTVDEAFRKAVDEACYDYGHAGYTGTIAEKDSYVVIKCPKDRKPQEYADSLINDGDPRIDDKWGPAGAIKLEPMDGSNMWLFFGWASS